MTTAIRELAIARMFKEVHGSWETHNRFLYRLSKLKISYHFNKYISWASVHCLQLNYNPPLHLKLTCHCRKCIAAKPVSVLVCVWYYNKGTIFAIIACHNCTFTSCKIKKRTLYTRVRASWIEFNNCPTRCDLFTLLYFCRQLYMFQV